MANIQIWFLQNGGVEVVPDPQPVMAGETIAWHVMSNNSQVRAAQISFLNPNDHFFPGGGGTSFMSHELEATIGQQNWSTVIWGIAPDFADNPHSSKYTVFGMKASGPPERLDPVIIIESPGPGGSFSTSGG